MKLFLSYSHEDTDRIHKLVPLLEAGGHTVFWDKRQGQILDEIEHADALLYAVSPHSVASEWCQWEFSHAIRYGRPIILVMVQDTPLPPTLAVYQHAHEQSLPADNVAKLRGDLATFNTHLLAPDQAPRTRVPPRVQPERVGPDIREKIETDIARLIDFIYDLSDVRVLIILALGSINIALIAILSIASNTNTPIPRNTVVANIPTHTASSTPTPLRLSLTKIASQLETLQSETLIASAATATESPTPSPSPTETNEDTAPVVPTYVALVVVDSSGQQIGEGQVKIYTSKNTVETSETVIVELEFYFESFFITPTPYGPVTRIPARSVTPPPTGYITPAPSTSPTRTPIYVSSETYTFYQRMGATLKCPPRSFDGCNSSEGELIGLEGQRWTWLLSAVEHANGPQDLQLSLWRLVEVNGAEQAVTVWNHNFRLGVTHPTEASEGLSNAEYGLIGTIGAALIAAIATIIGILIQKRKSAPPKSTAPVAPLTITDRVFISYRRVDTEAWSKLIYESLKPHVSKDAIFRDSEHINLGDDFRTKINEAVWSCDVLIAVIGKKWLSVTQRDNLGNRTKRIFIESDYVRLEIAAALQRQIRVIPVLVGGAKLPSTDKLPDNIKELAYCQAIEIRNESYDRDIQALVERLLVSSET